MSSLVLKLNGCILHKQIEMLSDKKKRKGNNEYDVSVLINGKVRGLHSGLSGGVLRSPTHVLECVQAQKKEQPSSLAGDNRGVFSGI